MNSFLTSHRGEDVRSWKDHFCYWLRKQITRDDPIGDLAQDYMRYLQMRYPFRLYDRKEPLSLALLIKLGSEHNAIKTYQRAKIQFAKTMRNQKLITSGSRKAFLDWFRE